MVTVPNHHKSLPALVWIIINLFIAQTNGFNNSNCAEDAYLTYLRAPNDTFLRDQLGRPTNQTSEAWGIGYQSCLNICGHNYSAQYYDWNFVSQGLTSWVLPWLALSAQLPFATNDTQTNFMVLMLALGSPSLIAFSLALTILNSRSINKRFRQIKRDVASLNNPQLAKAVKAARVLLIGSQQIPIQIYNGPRREFAQLVVRPENWIWWQNLREEIQRTKRGWTYSLYAQVGWVCVAQILAIADFFTTASFTTTIGIGLAINSLWIWMIPVVLGWVYVGTQTSAGSIEEAITRTKVPVLGNEEDLSGKCIGIRDRTSFDDSHILDGYDASNGYDRNREEMPRRSQGITDANDISDPSLNGEYLQDGQEHNRFDSHEPRQSLHSLLLAQKEHGVFPNDDPEKQPKMRLGHQSWPEVHPQSFFGFSIAGCELEPGPVFNFARVWSHMAASNHVGDGFAMLSQRQKNKQPVDGFIWEPHDWKRNLQGAPRDLSKYCSISFKDEPDLFVHGRSSAKLVISCMIAAFMAVILQWGSTGAAILIAYRTPVVGLGCQSGSYLIYGMVSTIIWITLFTSASLSHHLSMLREEAKPPPHWILRLLTVATRLIGKLLAAANATFIVVTSIVHFTGLYDNCWCAACIPSLGRKAGWVILFANDAQIAATSKSAWIGGVTLSILSALFVTIYIFVSRGDEIFKRNMQ